MDLRTFEKDVAADADHLAVDTRHFVETLVADAKAEARHLADPAQRESIIERRIGFFVFVVALLMAVYSGAIALVLSLPAPR